MADINLTAPTDFTAQAADIERRRKMAEMMQQQSLSNIDQQPNAGGWTVPISPFQAAAKMAQGYVGAMGQRRATQEQRGLAAQYRSELADVLGRASKAATGTPAGAMQEDGSGLGMAGQTTPAVPGNIDEAYNILSQHPGTQQAALAAQMTRMQQRSQSQEFAALIAAMRNGQGAGGPAGTPPQAGSPTGTAPGMPPQAGQPGQPLFPGVSNDALALVGSGNPLAEKFGPMVQTGYNEATRPQNMRPGGTLYIPGQGATFTAPQNGIQTAWGPNGPEASPVPGFAPAAAAQAAATAGGSASGKLPYEPPTAINTPGAPTLATPAQAIEMATGQPPPAPGVTRLTAPDDATARQWAQEMGKSGQKFSIGVGPAPQRQGLRLQDQSQSAAQRELGQGIGKESATTFTNGAAAVQANRQLDNIATLTQNFTPDRFQPLKANFGSFLNGMGIPENEVNSLLGTNVGDIRALTAAAVTMAGRLTRQTDAQPSQIQFLKNLQAMPQADMTPQGFAKVVSYMKDLNNYQIEKMIAQQQWLRKTDGDPSGFEADWARQAKEIPPFGLAGGTPPVQATINQGNASGGLPQAARAALKEGVQTKFGNGQTWTLRGGQPVQVQ